MKAAFLKGKERPAMLLLAGCFVLSAALRLFDPGNAVATELAGLDLGEARAAPSEPEEPVDVSELLRKLREREAQLDRREERLAEKSRIIEVAEAKLRDQLARLEDAETKLSDTLRMADQAAEKDVEKLVSAFETMSPKRAAPIFENMDIAFAAGLISRMKGPAAAEVLAGLTAEKAYAISVFIAGQNARAPRE
ncbi:MAG: hypothetical protein AAGF44_09885 [Pseudomonadota bacterium]